MLKLPELIAAGLTFAQHHGGEGQHNPLTVE